MNLSKEDVLNIAEIARLEFDEDELQSFSEQLIEVVNYAKKLSELDTTGVEVTSHILPIKNVFREDQCTKSLSREDALKNAPSVEKGCFKVPKVIE